MKKLVVLFLFLISFYNIFAQDGEKYINTHFKDYHSYGLYGMKTMEFKISSPEIIDYLKKNGINDKTYLLKALTGTSGEIYFRNLLDSVNYSAEVEQTLNKHFVLIEKQFRGVFTEFNLFLINTPFWDIPQKPQFYHDEKYDIFKFKLLENKTEIEISKYFDNRIGILKKQVYSTSQFEIMIFPYYEKVLNKWTCYGWDSQIFKEGKLSSGTGIRFDLVQGPRNIWLPSVIKMMTQTPEDPQNPIWTELYLHDFKINFFEEKK
ncbi:MAG: hypothetical protein KAR38_12165 [Calditrichia bacterium]|nr:hypothetical protein [Calditrichia bacterium]